MFKRKSKDSLAHMIAKIANAKPGAIFGQVQKMFQQIAQSNAEATCEMLETIILISRLNEDDGAKPIIEEVSIALVRRMKQHSQDKQLKSDAPASAKRVEALIESVRSSSHQLWP